MTVFSTQYMLYLALCFVKASMIGYVNVIYLGVSIDVGSKTVTGVGSFEEPDSLYGGFRVFEVNDDYSELSTPWVETPFIKRP